MISAREKSWLQGRWRLLQIAQQKADAESAAWVEWNDALNLKFEREGRSAIDKDRSKGINLKLKGHMATWDFHRRDADRFATEILAFEAMKRMEAL